MKLRSLHILLSALAFSWSVLAGAQQTPDSASFAALGAKLDSYMEAMAPLSVQEQEKECSFLIESCTDSLVRQYVALKLYSSYISSDVMGVEAVAIDIADNWFFNGKIRMKNDIDLMNARIYAEFNRRSLVGKQAEELTLYTAEGDSLSLFGGEGARRRYSVLYFYDTGCTECLFQSVMLRTFLASTHWSLDVYAVYTGADSLAWQTYRNRRMYEGSANVSVTNLWDPSLNSDFQRKYGVLKTPQMFLIGKDGVILGRKLDVPALESMLANIYASDDYVFGSEESMSLLEKIFGSLGDDFEVQDVNALTDRIASQSLPDVAVFKETVGDMFYWLSYQEDGRYKEAEKYVIDKYILSRPDIWDTAADTVNVIGYARTMSDLLSRSLPGTLVPDLRIYGTMASGGVPESILEASGLESEKVKVRARSRVWNIRRLPSGTYVFFFDTKCQHCRESLMALTRLMAADRRMKVLFVTPYDGSASGKVVSAKEDVLDAFDLQILPMTVKVGEKGIIQERYVDFVRLAAKALDKELLDK